MTRLLGILSATPIPFRTCFESLRRSSPSVPEEHFGVWSRAAYGPEDAWEMGSDSVMGGDNTLLALLAKAGSGFAMLSSMQGRLPDGRTARSAVSRRAGWVLAHDGKVEDHAYLLSRTNVQRACPTDPDADMLLAFVLSRLDERGLSDVDPSKRHARSVGGASTCATDAVISAAAVEIGRRIGSLSFLLCDGATLYAYRFDRSLHLCEREASARLPAAIYFASEPLATEGWVKLEDRTLVRCSRAAPARTSAGIDIAFLCGRDPRPISDVELPFTD